MGENIGSKTRAVIGHFQHDLLRRISRRDIDFLGGKLRCILNQIANAVNQFGLAQKLRFAGCQKPIWTAGNNNILIMHASLQGGLFHQSTQAGLRYNRVTFLAYQFSQNITAAQRLFAHQGKVLAQAFRQIIAPGQLGRDQHNCAQRRTQLMRRCRRQTIKRR